jgi:hypothetical protein
MCAQLLIQTFEDVSLDKFVSNLSPLICFRNWEQRFSSNYAEERYFRCLTLGLEITAAIADDSEFKDYHYSLHFEPEASCKGDIEFCDGLADCVARKLALSGFVVLRSLDFSRVGSGAVIYRSNPTEGTKPRDRVVTEEI